MCKARRLLTGFLALLLVLGAGVLTFSRLKPGAASWSLAPEAYERGEETMPRPAAAGRVSANHADAEELCTVKGIGPKLAAAIIDERERNGAFRYWEDLICVRGIGENSLRKLEGQLGLP